MHSKHFLSTLIVALGAIFAGCHTRTTDTVEVIAVDDGYVIHVRSEGNYLIPPISPDGPFPKWGESTRFRAQGAGKRVAIDGVIYKEYAIGKDLETTSDSYMFSTCVVRISEDAKRLIVQGQLKRKDDFNPSGTYDGITIDRPKVIALSASTKIEDIYGHYIRARGHYEYPHPQHPGAWQFRAEGKTFLLLDNLGKDGDFEIVGQVNHNGDDDMLGVSSYKRIEVM